MAASELFAQSPTVGTTEFSIPNNSTTLTPQTSDYTIQCVFDTENLAAGDRFQFTVYEKAVSGGTQHVVWRSIVTGAQEAHTTSPAVIVLHGWDVTVKKLAGTDRVIPVSVRTP